MKGYDKLSFDMSYNISPVATTVWSKEKQMIFVNKAAMRLFCVKYEDDIISQFERFSPMTQPTQTTGTREYLLHIDRAFETGESKFLWLHSNAKNQEIFCDITLKKIVIEGEDSVVVAFTEDLSPTIINHTQENNIESYFTNQISGHSFMNNIFNFIDEKVFYWDLRTGMITFYGGEASTSVGLNNAVKFPEYFIENGIVHHDFIDVFNNMVESALSGYQIFYDLKIRVLGSEYKFYRVKYNTALTKNGKIVTIIGTASDIDEEKALENRANTDLLTGCYNKITAENMITDHLHQSGVNESLLFIIDIDNFKAVNDNLGHHFGDVVLREVSAKLKACFRQDDIIGRIGGDEFIVLAKNLKNREIIEEKANKILEAFSNTYKGASREYKVSGSIGIARFPYDGKKFDELYVSADKALYQSKLKGKDCFTMYSNEMAEGTMKNRTILENAGRAADAYFDSDIITDVFNLLFETNDFELSLQMALQCIGRKYEADRSYIFESFDDGATYNNTYEWCEDGINPEIDSLQNISAAALEDFFRDADDEGIIYSNDLNVLKAEGAFELMDEQDIKSFIHSQIREKDFVRLFLGLDDCTDFRVWSPKELNSLKYLAKLLSIFLVHKNK